MGVRDWGLGSWLGRGRRCLCGCGFGGFCRGSVFRGDFLCRFSRRCTAVSGVGSAASSPLSGGVAEGRGGFPSGGSVAAPTGGTAAWSALCSACSPFGSRDGGASVDPPRRCAAPLPRGDDSEAASGVAAVSVGGTASDAGSVTGSSAAVSSVGGVASAVGTNSGVKSGSAGDVSASAFTGGVASSSPLSGGVAEGRGGFSPGVSVAIPNGGTTD